MVRRTEMIARLEPLISELDNIHSDETMNFKIWYSTVVDLLTESFGENSWQYKAFISIDFSPPEYVGGHIFKSDPKASGSMIPITPKFAQAAEDAQKLLVNCLNLLSKTHIESKAFYKSEHQENSMPKKVFITHGRSTDWREVVAYLEKDLKCETLELSQEVSRGATVIEKLEMYTPQCGFAVIVMTGDDTDTSGTPRVRENVMHEIGWFQAKYGRSNVCLLHENEVSIPTNISGIVYLGYPKGYISATFAQLRKEIEAAFPA